MKDRIIKTSLAALMSLSGCSVLQELTDHMHDMTYPHRLRDYVDNLVARYEMEQEAERLNQEQKNSSLLPFVPSFPHFYGENVPHIGISRAEAIEKEKSYIKGAGAQNFVLHEKTGDKIKFVGGTMIPIGEGRYIKLASNDSTELEFWSDEERKFSFEGELVLISREKGSELLRMPGEFRLESAFARETVFYLEKIHDFIRTNEYYYVDYKGGTVSTKLAKKTFGEEKPMVVERMRLPNGVVVNERFSSIKFDEDGNPIQMKNTSVRYSNPRIRIPFLQKGGYVVIPKNANWSDIIGIVKVSEQEGVEVIPLENLPKDFSMEDQSSTYPLPRGSYVEDRSGLEKTIHDAIELEQQGKIREAIQTYNALADPQVSTGEKIRVNTFAFDGEKEGNYLDPTLPLYNTGILHLKIGNIDEAIENFEKVFTNAYTYPDYVLSIHAHIALGNAYLQKGLVDRAEEEFKKILEMNPNQSDALYSLGALEYNERKNQEKAFGYWSMMGLVEAETQSTRENVNVLNGN